MKKKSESRVRSAAPGDWKVVASASDARITGHFVMGIYASTGFDLLSLRAAAFFLSFARARTAPFHTLRLGMGVIGLDVLCAVSDEVFSV